MVDPRTFKTDEDWAKAGYEYAFRCGCERAYVVINHTTQDALIMVDHGNGGCHFENYYPPRMREVLESMKEQIIALLMKEEH